MEKKPKKSWFEYFLFPSDFFEGIGAALTILGNFFTFDIDNDVKTNIGSGKYHTEMGARDFERILKSTRK